MGASSSSPCPKKRMIALKSSDGQAFEIEEAAASLSATILSKIKENSAVDTAIPIPDVKGETLRQVIEYCNKHAQPDGTAAGGGEGRDNAWDVKFVGGTDNETLRDLIKAANSLAIKGLLDLACEEVVSRIKGKPLFEILEVLNMKVEFSAEEAEEVRLANLWAFE